MKSHFCLCVCPPPPTTFEPTGIFSEVHYEGSATEGDLDAMIFNAIASTIPDWWMF
jgi:hypothetical protein